MERSNQIAEYNCVAVKYELGKKDHSIMSRNGAMLFGSSVLMNFMLLLAIIMAISLLMQKNVAKSSTGLVMGTSATVYKGVLAADDENFIAINCLDKIVRESELKFKTDVSAIGCKNNENLVKLL